MQDISVKVVDSNPNSDINEILVSIDYYKNRGGVCAAFYPSTLSGDGMRGIVITAGEWQNLEKAGRTNKKQIAKWEEIASSHIALRTGMIWDCVLLVCKKKGLTPVDIKEPI